MSGFGGWGGFGGARPPWARNGSETKPFFLTSEFVLVLLAILAMAISSASDEGFDARWLWTLVTILVGAYAISRGIAKSGTESRAEDPRENLRLFEDKGEAEAYETNPTG